MTYVISRMREPSTYAGVAALAAALGLTIPGEWVAALAALGAALAGVVAMVLPERK